MKPDFDKENTLIYEVEFLQAAQTPQSRCLLRQPEHGDTFHGDYYSQQPTKRENKEMEMLSICKNCGQPTRNNLATRLPPS